MGSLYLTLQYMYLGISLASTGCCLFGVYLVPCSNFIALTCLIDFCFVKKKDMVLHHLFVLGMVHYLNTHDIENNRELITHVMSSEISSIFLILNNLLQPGRLKTANQVAFVSTFAYYRIYNYTPVFQMTFYQLARNKYEMWEVYTSIYGAFVLNVYWGGLIARKALGAFQKCQ